MVSESLLKARLSCHGYNISAYCYMRHFEGGISEAEAYIEPCWMMMWYVDIKLSYSSDLL